MKNLLYLCVGIFLSFLQKDAEASEERKPNIILITAHDLGQHLDCYGVSSIRSPNIDKLAKKGIRFQNFYSTSAVCTPGRGSLLTGRYPQSNGLMGLTHAPWWWSFNEDEVHMAEWLKRNGYDTYLVGLQHVTQGSIKELGYQEHLSPNRKAEETVAASIELIENRKGQEKPFFAKIGFTEVHRSFDEGKDTRKGVFVPPYLENTEKMKSDLSEFQGTINYLDNMVGIFLDVFYDSEIVENTLIVFTSEHGIPYPGAKWCIRKAGIEIPLIMYRPNTVFEGGRVVNEVMSNVDVLPTILDHANIDIPDRIEGVSFYGFLMGNTNKAPRKAAFSQYMPDMKRDNLSRSIITKQYHLIRYFSQGIAVDYPVNVDLVEFAAHRERTATKGTRPFYQLYDIKEDPYELNDIGSDPKMKAKAEKLSGKLLNWMKKVNDPILEGPFRSPYYDRAIEDLTKE